MMRVLLAADSESVRCNDCTRRIHGADLRMGLDDKPYHAACYERLFPLMPKHQDGQGSLSFPHEERG